jgi:hypothetical protein
MNADVLTEVEEKNPAALHYNTRWAVNRIINSFDASLFRTSEAFQRENLSTCREDGFVRFHDLEKTNAAT